MITKELYDRLSEWQSQLWTAHHASYVRATKTSDLETLKSIYREIHGRPFDGSMNCNSCVVRLCKALYDDRKAYETESTRDKDKDPNPVQPTNEKAEYKTVKTKGTLKPKAKK